MAVTANNEQSSISLPYMNAYGNISKALERIQAATTPDRFTQDFLATKLNLKGGTAKPVIPFLKRTGFLGGDGAPTEQYKQFRNQASRGAAAAAALRKGFAALYEINEYAHELNDSELKGVVLQATGLGSSSKTAGAIVGSFKALRAFADFDATLQEDAGGEQISEKQESKGDSQQRNQGSGVDLKLGYTINLNLPATSDIAVFNAIFKSLRENLLDQ